MSNIMFPLAEYRSSGGARFAIDLRAVDAVCEGGWNEGEVTILVHGRWESIIASYEELCRDWVLAKKL